MKDLKIVTNTECFTIEDNNGNIFATFWENNADSESKAKGFIDAHNTYQRTGMTASELEADRDYWKDLNNHTYEKATELTGKYLELEKQRNELLEALKASISNLYNDYKSENEVMHDMRAAIQSVEQNEKKK